MEVVVPMNEDTYGKRESDIERPSLMRKELFGAGGEAQVNLAVTRSLR
jgi:hypothetical protein